MKELKIEQIVLRDPSLAGHIAARGWDWWDEATNESEANSVQLTGDRRADFLRGWNAEIADREQERKNLLFREYEAMAKGAEKGDPANW